MILGQFAWRGSTVEADALMSECMGEVVWLNHIDGTGLGVIRSGRLRLTRFAPSDVTAAIELRAAYDDFRDRLPKASR